MRLFYKYIIRATQLRKAHVKTFNILQANNNYATTVRWNSGLGQAYKNVVVLNQ